MSAVAVSCVFFGCQANLYFLELLVSHPEGKSIGAALTLVQFVAVFFVYLPFLFQLQWHEPWVLRLRPLRLRKVLLLYFSLLFVVSSTLNNIVFQFDISVPVHTNFRSSSLVVNMLLGFFWLKKRYAVPQVVIAVILTVSVGILNVAIRKQSSSNRERPQQSGLLQAIIAWWPFDIVWLGVTLLAISTVASAVMGIVQEILLSQARMDDDAAAQKSTHRLKGKAAQPSPALAWIELLALCHGFGAAFLMFSDGSSIVSALPKIISGDNLFGPMVANVMSQVVCVTGVYILSGKGSFVMTLVITFRKFASLVLSVVVFEHYKTLGVVEWASIVVATLCGLIYPFIRKIEK